MGNNLLFILPTTAISVTSYETEIAYNDELLIINSEKFKAKTYCFNMEEGNTIIFLEGSPKGVCVSAELLNLSTKNTCRVWCE